MKNTNSLAKATSSLLSSSAFPQVLNKLSGENITTIIVSAIAAGTICYVCENGGSLELSAGDKKVILNSNEKVAA